MYTLFIQAVISSFLLISCTSDDQPKLDITTHEASDVTLTSIISGGTITSDESESITARGVCWGKFPNPVLHGNTGRTVDGAGSGTYTSELKPLSDGTYYIRSYAKKGEEVFYGNGITFNMDTISPKILIQSTPDAANKTIKVQTNISYGWKDPILEKGICYSPNPNPSITQSSKIQNMGSSLSYSQSLSSIDYLTAIYFRAYVITKNGVFYSDQKSEILFPPVVYDQILDIDGNTYKTIKIGTNTWMASNLKVSKFNDGTGINFASSQNDFKSSNSEAYTYFKNDPSKAALYGFLYNGYVNNSTKNVCMQGWHIATYSDWFQLANLLGGLDFAGDRMKSVSDLWLTKQVATNESGFSGLPGGSYCSICLSGTGIFADEGTDGYWWSAQAKDFFYLTTDLSSLRTKNTSNVNDGMSIRCVKN